MKKIVVIGGGTGTFTVLTGLKKYPVKLSAIVSMADDGGSTGMLRDEYGVLPPGDIRRALVALSESGDLLRDLFNYRFKSGALDGHNFGNLFLSALEKITGDFGKAVHETGKLLRINGAVIPVTLNNVRLHARLLDGTRIKGEKNIDIPRSPKRAPIEKVWLTPAARINPAARKAILSADMIVIGPGDLYTSLIPNLLVRGVPEAIRISRATKVYVANLMTKFGETHALAAEDFVTELERYLGKRVLDFAIFNTARPPKAVLARYQRERATFIDPSRLDLSRKKPKYILRDLLDLGAFARHDPRRKLGKVLVSLL